MERWWGPGEGGSLILPNTVRPMPQVSLARMSSRRSSVPFLSGIGPWRSCDLSTSTRGAVGRGKTGYYGTTTAIEPRNQWAGFDARITSPLRVLPVTTYSQVIVEDSVSGNIPNRLRTLFSAHIARQGTGSRST
jgi:hypothetical protein